MKSENIESLRSKLDDLQYDVNMLTFDLEMWKDLCQNMGVIIQKLQKETKELKNQINEFKGE